MVQVLKGSVPQKMAELVNKPSRYLFNVDFVNMIYITLRYLTAPKAFTKNNNLKSPGYANVIKWISEIWANFDKDIIKKSFDVTGITSTDVPEYNPILRAVLERQEIPSHVLDDNDHMEDLSAFEDSGSEDSYYDPGCMLPSDQDLDSEDDSSIPVTFSKKTPPWASQVTFSK